MFFYSPSFYYVTIGLQLICVIHCIRRGRQTNWIWLIVFLPIVGSIAYIFTEIFSKRDLEKVQSGMGSVLNPSGNIKKLQANLRFSDTFNNKVALADAYLKAGFINEAIELYESSLTGNFIENEYVFSKLIIAFSAIKRYEEIVPLGKKLINSPEFQRSRSHILYAIALGYTGNNNEAEKEFIKMKSKFSNYEARYEYARFLMRADRQTEATQLLSEMLNESNHLSSRERRDNRQWFQQSRDELKKKSELSRS